MRSEAEIRRQVETRLRRWGLLIANGVLWTTVSGTLYVVSNNMGISEAPRSWLFAFVLAWLGLVVLHTLRVIYVELREFAVKRAVRREIRQYRPDGDYEKPKRLEISDDGELVDWRVESEEASVRAKHER